MNTRSTKQRTGILNFLCSREDHPTADVVYSHLRKDFPNLSLGTVYRNLNFLAEQGQILKLKFDDGLDHFDANLSEHHHFVCSCCGTVADIFDAKVNVNIPPDNFGGRVDSSFVYFRGLCERCLNKS